MKLRCLFFGHNYRAISKNKSVAERKELAKHEYDELRDYICQRCGKKISQEEHYQ